MAEFSDILENSTTTTSPNLKTTVNSSSSWPEPWSDPATQWTLSTISLIAILSLLTFMTLVGNLLVITAIIKTRSLRGTQYIFIFCLALTDFLLGLLVLPFATYMQITKRWVFGIVWCNIWTCLDVLLCTASVLQLFLITIDRHLAIKYTMRYHELVTKARITCCLVVVWVVSIACSFFPIYLGLNTADGTIQNIHNPQGCNYDSSNTVYSTTVGLVTFMFPLLTMFVMYGDILRIARQQSKVIMRQTHAFVLYQHQQRCLMREEAARTATDCTGSAAERDNKKSRSSRVLKLPCLQVILKSWHALVRITKENKATCTVFVIFGIFNICWGPYMIVYTFSPLWGGLGTINPVAFDLFLWAGYANSAINPFIYTLLNRQFREAVFRIITSRQQERPLASFLNGGTTKQQTTKPPITTTTKPVE